MRNLTVRLPYTWYREKKRVNNRSLERMYDAVYRDLRDDKKKNGKILSSGRSARSRELPYDNQRPYRANKLKKGHRSIRRQHYQLRPGDLVKYQDKLYAVKGINHYGKYIVLVDHQTKINPSVKKVNCLYHCNSVKETIC